MHLSPLSSPLSPPPSRYRCRHFSALALCELIGALEQVSKDNEDSSRAAGVTGAVGSLRPSPTAPFPPTQSQCMFSEAKLLEVTLANFSRLDLIWDKVIPHFMRVSPCFCCSTYSGHAHLLPPTENRVSQYRH